MAGNFSPFLTFNGTGNFGPWGEGATPEDPPVITLQPIDAVGHIGDSIEFTADADDYETVQWQTRKSDLDDWEGIPGGTGTTLTITAEQSIDNDQYRAVFAKNGEAATDTVYFYVGDFIINVGFYDGDTFTTYGYTKDRMGSVIQSSHKWIVSDSVSADVNTLDSSSTSDWAHAYTSPRHKWLGLDRIKINYRDPLDDEMDIALEWGVSGFSDYRVSDPVFYEWMETKNNKKLVVTVSADSDFIVSVEHWTDGSHESYGADIIDGYGAITPDDWKPDGKIEYVKILDGDQNDIFYVKRVDGGKWLDYNTLHVTASTATESVSVNVPYISNMYYNNNKNELALLLAFLKANVGNDVSFVITGSLLVMMGVTP